MRASGNGSPEVCAKCPVDSGAMETVYGMGAKKIESYGARFTQVITAFLNEHGSTLRSHATPYRTCSRAHMVRPCG